MTLPRSACPTGKVTMSSGEVVSVRGLTRTEALHVRETYRKGGVVAMEQQTLAYAFDVELDDVVAWYATADNGDVDKLSAKIAQLSGLDGDEGKDGAGASLSATQTSSTTS